MRVVLQLAYHSVLDSSPMSWMALMAVALQMIELRHWSFAFPTLAGAFVARGLCSIGRARWLAVEESYSSGRRTVSFQS
jgi:hypothetical protein